VWVLDINFHAVLVHCTSFKGQPKRISEWCIWCV
jgi:hypothetical protein